MELPYSLFLSFLLLFICSTSVSPSSSTTDIFTEALLNLKSELTDPQNTLEDWSISPEPDPSQPAIQSCSWPGITCNGNKTSVISIDLSGRILSGSLSGEKLAVFQDLQHLNLSYNSFSGALPVEIFNLTELRTLDISRNNFSREFPGDISLAGMKNLVLIDAFSNSFSGPLPRNLPQVETLEVLNLAGSYFSGGIPPVYGSFRSIKFIHLAGNFLSGEIPPELGNLQTLTHMEIGYNSYEGGIPQQFGNLSAITYLDIADANLSGPIPKVLSNLTKLESLFLFKNQLVGLIPWELGRVVSLTDLDLSDNLISGPVPESFSGLKNLRLLSLFYNSMNGTVPDSVAELPSLETLLIWNNLFSGPLPKDLGKNLKLEWVDVSTNYLVGPIPAKICSGGGLLKLIMFSNNFTGTLSPLVSDCASLVRLRLEDNSFSGEIPLNFTLISDISYIDLSRNNFTGPIPSDISRAANLQYFNVSGNRGIGGTIPTGIWSMQSLKNFSMSGCNVSGEIPAFGSCESVSVIELNDNALSGSLPESISSCRELEWVDFSRNHLTGQIPKGIARLPALSALDLSRNNFTGPIPREFRDSLRLRQFNISFNDVSGPIPSSKVFKSMDQSSFLGNERLCGAPLRPCPGSIGILGSKGTKGKLILVLLLCLGLVVLTALLALGIFHFIKGSRKGHWKMVSFDGLPRFTPNDIMRSFEVSEPIPTPQGPVSKAVLPTGITVSVKKLEWDSKRMEILSGFITRMGEARHPNLTRLLGFCHNREVAYLLYDHLPNGNLGERIGAKRDWREKRRVINGIARGLCYLHNECFPPIPHGDLKLNIVVFDENMEPRLTEFGFRYLARFNSGSSQIGTTEKGPGEFSGAIKEQLEMDVYNFGEIIIEVLTNGRLASAGDSIHNKPKEVLLREICSENAGSIQEEVQLVLEVALLCTERPASDRPTARDALKLLSEHKSLRK
ncbi:leucine-rich repeat receptor-like protein kinase TDR [Punica granatum]|uniref:Leucine-rich repeat receptor-like protein kinase TDR n=1 Tax=Punica granatum TaxID=22663 RepID=A0A6P8CH06_PUNGR|nr:leucine-rich repeat receptor-like protein kinase TDR [Punica granatum]